MTNGEQWLLDRVRRGESKAWETFISRYEGRLTAFVEHRLSQRSQTEDIVQETFIGFLNSLPNFDGRRSIESYLFSICAHKITDHLRRASRQSIQSIDVADSSGSIGDRIFGRSRPVSSIARSNERRDAEERVLVAILQEQLAKWKSHGDWLKTACIELIVVAELPNRRIAELLDISEQKVANYKSDFIAGTKQQLAKRNISADKLRRFECNQQ